MIVTREPKPFAPITIVIETEEEARCLWHRLKVPADDLVIYGLRNEVSREELECEGMWSDFDDCYDPMARQ